MKKILIVACLHGSETFGLAVANYFAKHKLAEVECIVGNPRAVALKVRFLDSDLNRSFGGAGKGYEGRRAAYLAQKIKDYNYVLDIHNTTTSVDSTPIAANLSKKTLAILNLHPSSEVALMPPRLARHALIGNHSGAVSLEYSFSFSKKAAALREVVAIVNSLLDGTPSKPKQRKVFYIKGTIPLTEGRPRIGKKFNFKYIPQIGGYGFLIGEEGYKTYQGFIATNVRKLII